MSAIGYLGMHKTGRDRNIERDRRKETEKPQAPPVVRAPWKCTYCRDTRSVITDTYECTIVKPCPCCG